MHHAHRLTTALLAACVMILGVPPAAATVYCWKDDSGQTQCGDRVPLQYNDKDRSVLNKNGQTVKVLPHAKTDAERAADEQAVRDKKAQAEQARYDKYLLSTFDSEDGLKKMLDERLAVLDGNIQVSELSLQNTEKSLKDLKARRERIKGNGRKPPPELDKQIADFERRLAIDRKGLETRKQERQAQSAKFERDIARYRALKGETGGAAAGTASN